MLAALIALVLAQTPQPSRAQAANGGDLVQSFTGTFACRTVEGVIVRQHGASDGNAILVHEDVERNGKHAAYEDRYAFDRALNRWHVQTGLGGFSADAPPPASGRWIVQAVNGDGKLVRMTVESLPDGDFRRTFAYDRGMGRGEDWFAYSVERCTPGQTPVPASACIAGNYPATTLEDAPAITSEGYGMNLPNGRVAVVVSLDEASRVTGVRIASSSAPELNRPALDRARRSKFRTQIVNCKPVAGSYIFTVDF
ncbi:MAG TPA: energy transducer TonB [Candidatus Limnocylindrales bacterium]|nr:energy transducer TonB [Candidatus Limnocylindrales bacterium]